MINLPIPAQAQHLLNTLVPAATSIEHLKIGQQIDANIVQISKDQQNIQLSIANKQVAAFLKNDTPENKQQAALLQPGQAVKLLLIKLPPQAEVKVLLPEQPIPANKPISASVTADIQRNAPTLILKTNQNNTQTLANSPNTLQTASRIAPQILPTLTNTAHSALLSELKPQQHLSATVIYSDAKNLKLRLFIPPSSLSSSATIAPRTAIQSNPVIQSSSETIKVQALITSKSTIAPPVTALPTTPQIPIATANLTSAIELPKIMALASPQTLIVDFPSSKSIPLPTLSPQQSISLQAIKTGAHTQFQILPPKSTEQTLSTTLKEQLPKQIALPELLNQLIRAFPQIISHEKVSETLKRLAQEILRDLPKPQQLTEGTQLKKSLNNSGLYLEAKLAHSEQKTELTLSSDFKAVLLKFIQALQNESQAEKNHLANDEPLNNLLKDLQSKSEGALARLILNQLKSLPQEDQNKHVWVIDLAFAEKKQTSSVKIEIEKNHKKSNKMEQKTWSATITLSPPHLNTLHCKISYFDNAIHTNFWSEDAKTTKLIQDNLAYLTTRFEEEGLTPGNMNAAHQKPDKSRPASSRDKRTLFDDNA